MEDLIDNFSNHISKMLSKRLGSQIENIISRNPIKNNEENYSEIETSIKSAIESFFYRSNDKDYNEIATNIYNSFVEKDDENIINAIKVLIRTYSYYEEMNMRKQLFKWRINSMNNKKINNYVISYQNPIDNNKTKSRSLSKNKGPNYPYYRKKSNIDEYKNNDNDNNKKKKELKNHYKILNNSNDIFERLYYDGMRKKSQQRTLEEIDDINKLNSRYN